jgi:hypothetical protein
VGIWGIYRGNFTGKFYQDKRDSLHYIGQIARKPAASYNEIFVLSSGENWREIAIFWGIVFCSVICYYSVIVIQKNIEDNKND